VDENENYHPYHKATTRAQNELISTLRPTSRKAWRKSMLPLHAAVRNLRIYAHLLFMHVIVSSTGYSISYYALKTEDYKLRIRIQLDQND